MIPATHDLPIVYRGDTMKEIRFELLRNDIPIDLTGAAIRCDFKLKNGSQTFRFSDANEKISIAEPATEGKFVIKAAVIDFPAGTYNFDIQVTFADGTINTFVAGTMKVIQDVTA
ncbi:MAG: hypothetical protein AB9842_07965 [Bacteroidales bacterium]